MLTVAKRAIVIAAPVGRKARASRTDRSRASADRTRQATIHAELTEMALSLRHPQPATSEPVDNFAAGLAKVARLLGMSSEAVFDGTRPMWVIVS